MANTILLTRGDSKNIVANFDDGTNAIDITGYTVFFTLKEVNDKAPNDDNAKIAKTITSHTDATAGETTIALDPSDTNLPYGIYKYDIQTKDPSGFITTVVIGDATVTDDVTKRTS